MKQILGKLNQNIKKSAFLGLTRYWCFSSVLFDQWCCVCPFHAWSFMLTIFIISIHTVQKYSCSNAQWYQNTYTSESFSISIFSTHLLVYHDYDILSSSNGHPSRCFVFGVKKYRWGRCQEFTRVYNTCQDSKKSYGNKDFVSSRSCKIWILFLPTRSILHIHHDMINVTCSHLLIIGLDMISTTINVALVQPLFFFLWCNVALIDYNNDIWLRN